MMVSMEAKMMAVGAPMEVGIMVVETSTEVEASMEESRT